MSLGHSPQLASSGLVLNLDAGNTRSLGDVNRNLYTSSTENFTSGVWSVGAGTAIANQAMSPDGSSTANLFAASGQYPRIHWTTSFSISASQRTCTFSTHVKYINQRYCCLINENGWLGGGNFDLIAGTASDTSSCTIAAMPNSWYRLTATFTVPAGAGPFNLLPQFRIGNYDGVNYNGSQIYIWGMQLELGSTATTYYPASRPVSTSWNDLSGNNYNTMPTLSSVEVLVVAGGGSGAYTGSGGGAGGVLYNANFPVSTGSSYTATVGVGGQGAPFSNGQAGGNSVFGSLTAIGGGGGVTHGTTGAGQNGGSGGGAAQVYTAGTSCNPGLGTDGQGFMGGQTPIGVNDWPGGSAGGGGAGGPGQRGGANIQGYGNGGVGRFFPQFVTAGGSPAGWFGGGGGGGEVNHGFITEGGLGGGGTGTPDAVGANGVANTGGGGAGGGYNGPYYQGGNGGSGIVIIRYPQPVRAAGGTITLVGNDVVHTFTSGTSSFIVNSSEIQLKNSPVFNTTTNSIRFNGTTQYVDCGNSNVLNVGNTITVIVWFNPSNISTYGPVVTKLPNDYSSGWELANSSGALRVSLRPGPSANLDLSGGVLSLNTWHMGAFTFDGTTCRLYLNGNPTVSGTPSGTITLNSTQNLWLGARVQGNYFAGDISQVTVYNRVLSAQEVQQNFNALKGRYGL